MPEYLAPGVYVEEISFRAKSIEGVATGTAGFLGPTRYGPDTPTLVTSLAEFERLYGDGQPLAFSDDAHFTHFLWHAVRAYFGEGGQRLYIGRTQDNGARPRAADYAAALRTFEAIAGIATVAAPGATYGYERGWQAEAQAVIGLLIEHCQVMRYRIAVIDCGDTQTVAQVRAMRARFDSSYAALYYPWVVVSDPISRQALALPPSGFVAGIYARNDSERGVCKAPANEVVRSAIRFEQALNKAQQDVLNPAGINCFRFFTGRGLRLWGARLISSDPEWRYVNLRRYFNYLERSIDQGTQWAVFEPNGEPLWSNLRQTISDFLFNEWKNGALLGNKPERAYFVRCDRSTMSQNDLDNGRLVCLVGVAPLRPAEFVIFRIGQWTADAKR